MQRQGASWGPRIRMALRRCRGAVTLVGACAAGSAHAAAGEISFNVPAGPLKGALVDFAVQADISLGLEAIGRCAGTAHAVKGRFTVEQGLSRLLAGSGCAVHRLDARAYELQAPLPAKSRQLPATGYDNAKADLSELVVVATRRATPADRLAYAVSSIPRNTLEAQGVRDISDLAMIAPAMTVTNLGMGRDKVLLRGLSDGPLTGRTQSLVSLYLDDARLTFNAPDPDLRLVDMERIEILRGPQGTLYGAGSLGGVLHMVSAPPDPGRRAASAAVSYGFTAGGAPSSAVDAVLNLPLLADRAAARLVIYHELDGGYIDNRYLNIDNVNHSSRDGGRFSINFNINNDWTVSSGVVVQDIISADAQYTTPGIPSDTRNTRIQEPSDNDFREYNIGVNGNMGFGVAHGSVSYISHNIYNRYAAPTILSSSAAAFDEHDTIQSIATEETLASPGSASVQWLAGVFFAHTTDSTLSALSNPGPPVTVGYHDIRHDGLDEGAFYGEATVPIHAGWRLTAGGRLFASRDRVSSVNTIDSLHHTSLFSGVADQIGFAPKFVLADRVSPSALLYVQADQGYRAPGINTAAGPGEAFNAPGSADPQRMYKGDQLWSLEAGAKLSALDGHLNLRLAGFDVKWKDIESDQLLASGLPYTANVGNGRNLGLEVEGVLREGALELRTEMLLDSPELNRPNPNFPLLADSSLGAVPDQIFGAYAHYAWRLDARRSLELNGHWTYVGGSHLMLNVAALPKEGNYQTGRFALSLVDPHWRLTLAVDNPANIAGDTFAYGNPFTIRSTQQVTPLRPRTITLSAEAGF